MKMITVARSRNMDLREQLKPPGDTAQGLYIVGADGSFYGFHNDHPNQYNNWNLGEIKQFLESGLKAFAESPPANIAIPQSGIPNRSVLSPDPTTSVIRVFSRISPLPSGASELNSAIGRDHFWILENEVAQIASAAHDNGESFWLPSPMVARLARYHIIDNVRGEPDMWTVGEVKKAQVYAKLVARNAQAKNYQFHGDFSQRTADGKRGLDCVLDGEFDISIRERKIVRFRAFAHGQAWGAGRFTEGAPPGCFPLLIAMIETNDEVAKIVPPEAMGEWREFYLDPQATDR